jgi:imidazolonepropionase-like amidohydrolase
MITRTTLILLLAASLLFAQTTPELGIRSKTPTLMAFTNARIVVSPDQTIERGTMVIDDGVIVAVGPNVTVPRGATVYDLTGKTLYPGFIEPFGQYGVPEAKKSRGGWGKPPKYDTDRIGANAWNGAIHAEKNWVDRFQPDKKTAEELLDLGFTVVQSASLDGVFRGRPVVVTLGEGLPNDLVLRRAGHHFVSFDKGSSDQDYPSSLMGSIALVRQTLLDADWYGKARQAWQADPTQPQPETNLALAGLANVTREGIVFETTDELSLARAEKIAQEFSMPVVHVGSGFEYARLDDVAATGRTLILPLAFPDKPIIKTVGDEYDVSLATLRHWETAPSNPARLEQAGVRFAFSTHRLKKKSDFTKNLRTAIERGLSKSTALAALTTFPAQIAGVDDRVGTLEQGKLANFIITDGDIFEKKTSIFSVWVTGQDRREKIALDQVDFRGTYKLVETWVGDKRRDARDLKETLTLKGDLTDLKGELKMDTVSVKLSDISVGIAEINFSATLDTFGIKGIARYSGRKIGERLEGVTTLGNGSTFNWAFEPAVDSSAEKKDEDKEKKESSDTLVARITHPNKAFGNETQPARQTVLVQNATIWTCDAAGRLEASDILFQDGKIKAIGKDLAAPGGAIVIDGTGKHVTPGIIDEHSHVAISQGVNEGTHAVTSEVRIGDVIDPDDISIYRELAGGTTICQSLHGSANPIGGQAQVIKFRWGGNAEEMKFQAAPPSIKFALGENVKQSNWGEKFTTRYPQSRMGVETIIGDAFQAAVEYEKEWSTFNALSRGDKTKRIPPRRNLQLDALVQIKNSEMWIHCHSYVQTEVLMLMRLAESFGFRIGTFTHILEGYKVADEMAAHGAGGSCFSDWWAYKFEVYDAIPYNTCIMADRGVVTSINSDSDELGRHLNQEAAKSVQYCGISEEEALKFATINPAIQLKIDNRVGSLTVGKDADFVIWNGNPLSLYSRCEQTWIDGRKYFDLEEDAHKAEMQRIEKNALVQKVLGNNSPEVDYNGAGYKTPEKAWDCEDVLDVFRHTVISMGGNDHE